MLKIFMLVLCFLCTIKLYSQSSFGVQWQIGSNQLTYSAASIDMQTKNTFYYSAALLYRYQLNNFSFQAGLGYMPVKYNFDFYDGNHFKSSLHYLSIPLQINYKIPFLKKQGLIIGVSNDFNFRLVQKEEKLFHTDFQLYNENIHAKTKLLQITPKLSLAYQIEILDEELLEIGIFTAYEIMKYQLMNYPQFNQERQAYSIINKAHSFRLGIETKIYF